MISFKAVPIHPFWKFSLKFYREPMVEQSLLTLQNERGFNINVLLFCCWYALGDQGRLSKIEFRQILTSIQPWHDHIVVPLRRIRQQLKPTKETPWQVIREDLLRHELFSEQIEQLILLDNFIFTTRPVKNGSQKVVDICKSVATYCQMLQIHFDERDCEVFGRILQTLFPKIDPKNILRYCMDHLIIKELKSVNLSAQLLLDL